MEKDKSWKNECNRSLSSQRNRKEQSQKDEALGRKEHNLEGQEVSKEY